MAKPSFRTEVVRNKLKALVPSTSAFEAIPGGEESQVFRFDSDGQRFILRINSSIRGFEKDAFAHTRFASPELTIPKVTQMGDFEDHFYCVSERLPGRTLQDLHLDELPPLLLPTAHVWQAIAESDLNGMSGFGPFDGRGAATCRTWRDFLFEILDTATYDWTGVRMHTKVGQLEGWLERFEMLAAACPEQRALVHGDFGSNNVLTDGRQITGVVDWSEAMMGDPLYDVANLFFWRTWLTCMEQQARYFEAHPLKTPGWDKRLLCYQLRIGLAELYGNTVERRTEALSWTVHRCEDIARQIDPVINA